MSPAAEACPGLVQAQLVVKPRRNRPARSCPGHELRGRFGYPSARALRAAARKATAPISLSGLTPRAASTCLSRLRAGATRCAPGAPRRARRVPPGSALDAWPRLADGRGRCRLAASSAARLSLPRKASTRARCPRQLARSPPAEAAAAAAPKSKARAASSRCPAHSSTAPRPDSTRARICRCRALPSSATPLTSIFARARRPRPPRVLRCEVKRGGGSSPRPAGRGLLTGGQTPEDAFCGIQRCDAGFRAAHGQRDRSGNQVRLRLGPGLAARHARERFSQERAA